MEGLLDFVLRDILTRVGGIDRCVSEFIRITDQLLPERVFIRIVPELLNGSRTPAGVPVRAQLLGSDPACMADNAARLADDANSRARGRRSVTPSPSTDTPRRWATARARPGRGLGGR